MGCHAQSSRSLHAISLFAARTAALRDFGVRGLLGSWVGGEEWVGDGGEAS